MPSTATITSFYVFSAGNRAKALEVTSNFNTFRGHLIAVDGSLSAAAVSKSYDLGSSDHIWGGLYAQALDISITSTAAMVVQGLSSGAVSFKKDGSTLFKLDDNGYVGINATPMAAFVTATQGNVAAPSDGFNTTITASGVIVGSTITIQTNGRRVALGLIGCTTTSNNYLEVGALTSGAISASFAISVVRDGTTLPPLVCRMGLPTPHGTQFPGGAFFFIDLPSAGLHTYYLTVVSLTANSFIYPSHCRLMAWEF